MRHVRRRTILIAGVILVIGLGAGAWRAVQILGIGVAWALDGLIPSQMPFDGRYVATAGQPMQGTPATRELDAVVARAFGEPDPRRPRRTLAVVVVQDGRVVSEEYAPGISAGTALAGWSMTKSVMNALIGTLVERGLLTLDGPVPIPEWRSPGDTRAGITLDSLLRMSSGLEFDENMSNPRSDVMRTLLEQGDTAKLAIRKPLIAAPGASWQYSSGTSNILARVLRNVLHDDARYLDYPHRASFDRIGLSSAVMETDASGTFVGSSFMYATAREWGRFGMLYLQDGVWNDECVLPEGWVTYTTSPAPADPDRRYGAHFWLQIPDEYLGSNYPLPLGTYHAVGHEGQFVTIVPARGVVIVRLGHTRYPEAWDHSAFVSEVLAALTSRHSGRAR